MAITRPPTPPSVPPPPEQPAGPPAGPPPRRVRRTSTLGRALPVAALALVVLIIAYLIFSGSGTTTYQLILPNAYQLVRGNTVQVGGVPVGSVTNIVLTKNFQAKVTIRSSPRWRRCTTARSPKCARPRCRASPTATCP